MAETATPDKELRVGDGWRYQCWKCNRQVKIDKPFPKECPGCGAGGSWWGHLVTPENGKITYAENTPGGIMVHKRILSQLPDDVGRCPLDSEGIYKPSHGQGRGRPRQNVPDDLIMELSGLGLSSRGMVKELATRGYPGKGYKVIQRRLKVLSRDNGGDTL